MKNLNKYTLVLCLALFFGNSLSSLGFAEGGKTGFEKDTDQVKKELAMKIDRYKAELKKSQKASKMQYRKAEAEVKKQYDEATQKIEKQIAELEAEFKRLEAESSHSVNVVKTDWRSQESKIQQDLKKLNDYFTKRETTPATK